MSEEERPNRAGKLATGISGFDQLTGGIAANRTTLLIGAPGTGKSLFALQTLVSGARTGEPGIYVNFDPDPNALTTLAQKFAWDLVSWEQKGLLFPFPPVNLNGPTDVQEMFGETLCALSTLCRQAKAKRIVFDSFDVLLRCLDDNEKELRQAFLLRDWLFQHELTVLLTARLSAGEPAAARRYALMQVIADCSVALGCHSTSGAEKRYLRVLKYRGSTFIEHELPFTIGASGIEVSVPTSSPRPLAGQLPPDLELARKELEARIQPLDRFLEMKQAELDFLLEKQTELQIGEDPAKGKTDLNRPDL